MSTRYCVPLILLLLALALPRLTLAATVNAASCSLSDVQTAINSAAAGDTVHLPTCNQTSWGNTSDSTVEITKRIILEGNGTSATVLHRSAIYADYPSTSPMFLCNGATGFEMRNMTLDGTYDTHPNVWRDMGIRVLNCVDFRIHHMAFTNFGAAIQVQHDPLVGRGLIDHNTFTDMRYVEPDSPQRLGYGVSLNGSGTYPALSLGTAQNLFIEDNTFTRCRHSVGSNNGSRYVARYNTVIRNSGASLSASAFDAHGDTASWPHGSRQYEVYENCIIDSTTQYTGVGPRGGDGVIFNNRMSPQGADGDIALSNDSGCSGTTYPRFDQIRDLHIWGNMRHSGSCSNPTVPATIGHDDGCADEIQLGRDYFTTARPNYTPFTYPHPGQGGVAAPPDFTTALRMHLKFDEGTLTTAQDSTVNNHDGTLANGATWGAPTMGTSALALDGVNDEVNVTGLLSSPAAITLAAWVLPTTYGTDGGDVISIGNVIQLRVASGTVRAHYWNGSTFTVLAGNRPTTGQWQHVAVTIAAGAQRLYLNGQNVASASAGAPISYTGQGSNTFIGTHGNGGTLTRYGGLIDDVRVYTRALTGTDISGLANLEDPPPLSIQITTPTTDPSYSTSTALLANLGGVASDETGVTGITWNCPTCATTSGSATCTPACGASTEDVNWNIPAITLAPGNNTITVTAADASSTRPDSITVTYTAPPVTGGAACTHYASSETAPAAGFAPGKQANTGTTQGSPQRIIDMWSKLTPGKVLCLLDGTYTGGNNLVHVPTTFAGTPSQPITIRALNDGKVLLDGNGTRTVDLRGSWGILEGVNAITGDNYTCIMRGEHWIMRRVVCWNNRLTSPQGDMAIIGVTPSYNTAEDVAAFGVGRKIIQVGQHGVGFNTLRRAWARWESCGTCGPSSSDSIEIGYDQQNITVENVISTHKKVFTTTSVEPPVFAFSTVSSRLLGSIAYGVLGDEMPVGTMIVAQGTGGTHEGDTHMANFLAQDNVAIMPPGHPNFNLKGFDFRSTVGTNNHSINNVSIVGGANICSTGWTCTGMRQATTMAALLNQYPNPKPATIFHALPGICKRYTSQPGDAGSVLTTEGLWPWPMNQRIKDALVLSGRAPTDVTATIEGLLGTIPAHCKTSAVTETCPPPRVGTPPNCTCPVGTVEPNCEPTTEETECTHYASPTGVITNDGTHGSPYRVADFWGKGHATPGKILCLHDGTYTGADSMIQPPDTFAGTEAQPITIRTLPDHEGLVTIDGEGTLRPADLQGTWGVLEGVNLRNGPDSTLHIRGDDWKIRRVVAYDAALSGSVISLNGFRNTVEDCAAFGAGAATLSAGEGNTGTSTNVMRRCWAQNHSSEGDSSVVFLGYGQDGLLAENVLGNWRNPSSVTTNPPLDVFGTQNSRILGTILYALADDPQTPTPLVRVRSQGGLGPQFADRTINLEAKHLLVYSPPTNLRAALDIAFDQADGNSVTDSIGVGSSSSFTNVTQSNNRTGTTIAGALSGSGHSNVWTANAGVCKRYVDGTLTNTGLWPWPMNQRIKDAMVAANRGAVDVTATMESLFGPIPAICKTEAPIQTCTPPRVGAPPNCSCPAGTVEPNCEPEPEDCAPNCPPQDVFVIATTGSPGPAGSDAVGRACSLAEPCATINRARQLMTPGDTLYLRGGTYTGAANRISTNTAPFPAGNSWSTPTRIAGYGNETAVLQQATDVVMWFRNPATDRYIVVDRLTCDGATTPSNNTQCLIVSNGAHHLRFQNFVARNTHFAGITIENVNNIEVLTSLIHGVTHANGIDVQSTSDSILLDGNTVHTITGHGVNATGTGVSNLIVRNSISRNNTGTGFMLGSTNLLAANLLAHTNALGVRLTSVAVDGRLYNATVADNSGVEVQVDAGATGTLLTNVIAVGGITNNGTGTVQTTNLTTDPGFVGGGNYRLALASSPAADAGTDLSAVFTTSLGGETRPVGNGWDVGAYEQAGEDVLEPIPGVVSGRPWKSRLFLMPQ